MTEQKRWSEIVLEERDKGNAVCILLPDTVGTQPVKEMVKQPTDGLLWDLNRDEATALAFMDKEGMLHWVNNFAVALVIRELKSQLARAEREIEQLKEALGQKVHRIEIAEDGWSIEHLVTCRPNMTECPVHIAVSQMPSEWFPSWGRYEVELSKDGDPIFAALAEESE